MSKSFYVANGLHFDNFIACNSDKKFSRFEIESPFSFSKIIGGDKSIFFICSSSNRLVEINAATQNRHNLQKVLKTPITLIDHEQNLRTELTKVEYPHMMEESLVFNVEYFMGKDYVYLVDKIAGNVGSFRLTTGELAVNNYSDHGGIRKFITGPLSSCHVVLTCDGTVFENSKEVVFYGLDEKPNILKAACCGRGSILATNNDLYARGDDNVFQVFSVKLGEHPASITSKMFVHIAKFDQKIRDIQCGYFHTVVLLDNNDLLACGYNCLNQSSWNQSNSEVQNFTKIQYPFSYIERFGCSSRGTYVISNNEVTMIGEVVEHFTTHITTSGLPKIIKFNMQDFNCDTLTNCGWHYLMYKQNLKTAYFKARLGSMVNSEKVSDISFDYQ